MKDKIKYINFMIWYQCDTKHLNYDPVTAANEYIKFIGENPESKCQCMNCKDKAQNSE